MGYKVNPLDCAYALGAITPTAGQFPFVALYNNDNLGKYIAVHDVAIRGGGLAGLVAGGVIRSSSVGANDVTPSPVVTNAATPQGVLRTGSIAALPAFNIENGFGGSAPSWPHEYPLLVLAPGWSLAIYAAAVSNLFTLSFWWQSIDAAGLMGVEPAPKLEIPKVLKLTVETE